MTSDFSHFDDSGNAVMVDVTAKSITSRSATASCKITMKPETILAIKQQKLAKGDVITVAQIAGISAAKQTHHLIPLCHPLPLSAIKIDYEFSKDQRSIVLSSTIKVTGKTGVEMEALTSVSIAALTVYDMCKSVDKSISIHETKLIEKYGGKSGTYKADQ